MNLYNVIIIIKTNFEDFVDNLREKIADKNFNETKGFKNEVIFKKGDIKIRIFYCPTNESLLSKRGNKGNVILYEDGYLKEFVENTIMTQAINHYIRENVSHETILSPFVGTLEGYSNSFYYALEKIY